MSLEDHFTYDTHRYNFEPIYETIRRYYPIENPEINAENIERFSGFIESGELINENFFNQKNYRERWGKFKKFLKQELKKPVRETMSLFYPCYSGSVTLNEIKEEGYSIHKELHFYISLLGPYYSVSGIDRSEIVLDEERPATIGSKEEKVKVSYSAVNAITVSPYLEYEASFKLLQSKIEEYFPEYRFIPFKIGKKRIPGISLIHQDSKEHLRDSVFSALFRPDIDFAHERGDGYYGYDYWLRVKPLPPEEFKKIIDGLLKRSLVNFDTLTLHKVWKFKSAYPIFSNPAVSNMTFVSVDLMDILDLTDRSTAFIITNENRAPEEVSYTISDNEIHFDYPDSNMSFKVSKLTVNELVLTMRINSFEKGNITLQGDIVEMIFERFNTLI